MYRILLTVFSLSFGHSSQAQIPPSKTEVSAYEGLHKAANIGGIDLILELIENGADVNARDHNNRTPTHVAAFASNDEALVGAGEWGSAYVATVSALISAGANAEIGDNNGVTPLEYAQMRGFTEIASIIKTGS